MTEEIKGTKAEEIGAGLRGLIKSMVALAASDRIIDEREVWAIGAIFNDLTGKDLNLDEVRRSAEAVRDENISIGDMLVGIEKKIHPEFKKTIIKACYLVSMADEILVPIELEDVKKVGTYLKVDQATVDEIIIEMEKMIQAEQPYH
ncbi:MAG: TerB family tellurite resistance protein [Sphingomonadales bacterium]